ncbi:MAG: C40 family peptidase [Candidatus Marinimicrobia bacterium]|nr:C40 family peptidase [Candidatus Neomarinimicrobiota bacterium]MBL7022625.1 C40 family peptidase [Candidatus Neomarinimicrobiota bacterium]MBL7109632.1 C40 family peptidase [Candidatus Neomarinimicrobiota bacterium]
MNKLIVNTTTANIYREPSFTSEMITQAIMWEELEILESHLDWFKVRQWDNYEGWIHQFYSTNYFEVNAQKLTVENRREYLFNNQTQTGKIIGEVVFGTELPILQNATNNWFEVLLPNKAKCWINNNNSIGKSQREQIIIDATKMLGVPYLWGGKTSLGFDCSGFVQTIFKNSGILLHRDSCQQLLTENLINISFDSAEEGDLMFFAEENNAITHVAISIGNGEIIHASGDVKIESLNENSENCNIKLLNMMTATKSISSYSLI